MYYNLKMKGDILICLSSTVICIAIVASALMIDTYVKRSEFIKKLNDNICFTNNTHISKSNISPSDLRGKYKVTNIVSADILYFDNNNEYYYRTTLEVTDSNDEAEKYRQVYNDFEFECFTYKKFAFLQKPPQLYGQLIGGIILVILIVPLIIITYNFLNLRSNVNVILLS